MTEPTIDKDDLIAWADKAVQDLQEFCDDAQQAAGNPDGEDQLPGTRALIAEYDAIKSGKPTWQSQMADDSGAEFKLSAPDPAELKVWKFDDCDYVAAYTKEDAIEWYEKEITEIEHDDLEDANMDMTVNTTEPDKDEPDNLITFREAAEQMIKEGDTPPFIIATDAHYL